MFEGITTVSWNDINGVPVTSELALFTLRFHALKNGTLDKVLNLSSGITKSEAYIEQSSGEDQVVDLNLSLSKETKEAISEFEKALEKF